jgi:hypothetical protein
MTVAELRLALDTMEQYWSAQDLELLGQFKDQGIFVDVIGSDGRYAGIGTPAPAHFDACFGVMLIAPVSKEATDG